MSPGRVDLKVVGDRLAIVDSCLADLASLPQGSLGEFVADRRNPLAAEALLRRALEALFDATRHLLAKAHGVGRLEYREVARGARDTGLVADPGLAERFAKMAGFRNRLTHYYDEVTPAELFGLLTAHVQDIRAVADALRAAAARVESKPGPSA